MQCTLRVSLLAVFAVPAGAQLPPHYQVSGDAAGDWFGYAVAPAGDVDGDGVPDFMVGAHQNLNGGHSQNPGYARIYSGASGLELYTLHGDGTNWTDGPDDHFGLALDGIGDIDGDGRDDLVVGAFRDDNTATQAGMVRVFSGASGAILHQIDGTYGDHLGIAVAGCPDADGDGLPDFMFGVSKADNSFWNAGSTEVYSSASGVRLFVFDGISEGDALGWACRPAGDVDADGVDDFVSGAPYWNGAQGVEGYAVVHSGRTGLAIHEWFGDDWFDNLGHAVDGAGDVDGDGHADVIVGAIESGLSGPVNGNGFVRVYSGASGRVLHELHGDDWYDQLGLSVRGAGDVDGDGRADFLAGAPQGVYPDGPPTGQTGYARLYSGRDGTAIYTFRGHGPDDQLGVSVARLADIDGDGHPEFLLGATEDVPGQTRAGYAKIFSGALVLTDRYCTSVPNSAGAGALLYHSGSLSVAENDLALRALGCPPNHFGLFYYGTHAIEVPFGDGFRCVGGATFRLGVVNTGAEGSASLALDLANPPQPAGRITAGSTWHFQFWYRDVPAGMSGFNLSDGLTARFAP